ncbi:MAG: tetratricopeptide repeat protein [Anaerolineales bacterium]|nr:tetratricopeptide repeat protein [Anaerolineales bacterium]
MNLTGERLDLSRGGERNNPWRIIILVVFIAAGVLLLQLEQSGQVQPLFLPTPTPTRTAQTFAEEGMAHFSAGDLDRAIQAYQQATLLNPNDAVLWADLARIQVYSSDLLPTSQERMARLAEARASIEAGVAANPDSAFAHAVRALVYDWSAAAEYRTSLAPGDLVFVQAVMDSDGNLEARTIEPADTAADPEEALAEGQVAFSGVIEVAGTNAWIISGRSVVITQSTLIRNVNRREQFLTEAEAAAVRSRQLDPGSKLALAFYAEVLVDQQKFAQALDLAQTAVEAIAENINPDPYDMDVHRVYGTVLENYGLYASAINEYLNAVEISPNLTFLYIRIGANYRRLLDYARALEYFDLAARTNAQLGIEDPTPYMAIGRTYLQQGEFFVSMLNIEQALAISPTNADYYGQLGIVYFKARNYESAIPVLQCAVEGCTPEENGRLLCNLGMILCEEDLESYAAYGTEVVGLPLSDLSLEYYYTYGSVLAAYDGEPEFPNACQRAEIVFQELMALYGSDPIVAEIVAENRAICSGVFVGTPEE